MDNRMARTFVDNVIETSQQEIDRSLVVSEDMRSDFASKADNQLLGASQSTIEHKNDADANEQMLVDNSLECFISQNELQQLLQLESSLFNLIQETSIADFMVPNREDGSSEFRDEDYDSFMEP